MSIRYFSCSCHLNPDVVCRHDNDPFNARRMRTDWTVNDFNGLSESQVAEINASNQPITPWELTALDSQLSVSLQSKLNIRTLLNNEEPRR